MTKTPSSTTGDLARHLLAREALISDDPAATGAAMQQACIRLSENLRRSVGDDGHAALLGRAFARTQGVHPALIDLRAESGDDIYLDGVVASVQAHGVPTVAAALESLFATLIDVLSDLIGADMVLNLLDHDGSPSQAPHGRQVQ